MANKRISDLDNLGTTPDAGDIVPITDVSDTLTSGNPNGTTKGVTFGDLTDHLATQVSLGNHAALTSTVHGISAFGATLVDDADASAARTTLGLGTAATSASTAFSPAFFTTVSDTTTARTLGDSDNGKVIVFSNSSAVTVTVPDGLTSGFGCTIVQGGNGKVTVVASGAASVNAYNAGSGALNTTAGQYAALQLIPTGSDAYTLSGDGGLPPFLNTYSLSFDGTNDYLATTTAISISGAKSMTFWIKPDGTASEVFVGSSAGSYKYWFNLSSPTTAYIRQGQALTGFTSWNATDWFHVAIISNGSNITGYVNGGNATTGLTDYDFDINTFGANDTRTGNFADGLLDEVGIWNSALTLSEVQEIYGSSGNREFDLTANSGNYSSASSLQHYYRMGDNDSGSSSTVTDNAGSNDLTVNGATSSTTVPS